MLSVHIGGLYLTGLCSLFALQKIADCLHRHTIISAACDKGTSLDPSLKFNCAEDKATISRALDYLETNGFLTSRPKNAKRYKSPLILTQKGEEVGKKIADKIDGVLDEIGDGLTESERNEFYRSLFIISESLEAVASKYYK